MQTLTDFESGDKSSKKGVESDNLTLPRNIF